MDNIGDKPMRLALTIIAALAFIAAAYSIESDARQACGNSQACLAASL
jgi:hypothetical protein